jgi:hypothetical protein
LNERTWSSGAGSPTVPETNREWHYRATSKFAVISLRSPQNPAFFVDATFQFSQGQVWR